MLADLRLFPNGALRGAAQSDRVYEAVQVCVKQLGCGNDRMIAVGAGVGGSERVS